MKINPNNFFKRELDILPPHFVNTVVKAHEVDVEKMSRGSDQEIVQVYVLGL